MLQAAYFSLPAPCIWPADRLVGLDRFGDLRQFAFLLGYARVDVIVIPAWQVATSPTLTLSPVMLRPD